MTHVRLRLQLGSLDDVERLLAMSMFDSREKLNDLGIELDSRSMKSDR